MCKLTAFYIKKGIAPKKIVKQDKYQLKNSGQLFIFWGDMKKKQQKNSCDIKADVTYQYQCCPHENRVRRIIDVDIILMMNRSIVRGLEYDVLVWRWNKIFFDFRW